MVGSKKQPCLLILKQNYHKKINLYS